MFTSKPNAGLLKTSPRYIWIFLIALRREFDTDLLPILILRHLNKLSINIENNKYIQWEQTIFLAVLI